MVVPEVREAEVHKAGRAGLAAVVAEAVLEEVEASLAVADSVAADVSGEAVADRMPSGSSQVRADAVRG